MHISKLVIRNFRNFKNATFHFKKGVNTLIGENGSGKTNAFYAIRLLIDDNLSRRATRLRESDFNRALDDWKGHWIIISLDFEELDTSEGCQIIRHNVGHMTEENRGTYTFIYRPKKEIRQRLFELSESMEIEPELKKLIKSITIEDYESIFTGRALGNFSDENQYQELVGNFQDLKFSDPDEEDLNRTGVKVSPLHYELSCTFAKALRDVVSDLRGYRDNPLLGLLRGSEKNIEVEKAKNIIESVVNLNEDISKLDEITRIAKGIQQTLYTTVGYTYSPEIDIKSSLPEDIEKLLQRLSLKVGDSFDGDYQGDLSELSLGGANLIYLSLKLLEYEYKLASDRVAHFLLIEEPEAHIHTHIQMTLFEKYAYEKTQVIVSTHSTHISSASKIRSVNILSKGFQEALVFHPSLNLEPKEYERIERYLDALRSTLLFAKGVMVVEGDAEMILIPNLIKQVFGISLDELGISLINMGSTVFGNIVKIFHDDRIRRYCAIITDLDESIYMLPIDPEEDDKNQKKSRDSQIAGEERQKKLDAFCNGNKWINAFYAKNTFEVDFLMSDNSIEIVPILDEIYTKAVYIENSKKLLKDGDVSVSGKEVLRLAQKEGKGWFALMISEQINGETIIPNYILKALSFVSHTILSDLTLQTMGLYRIKACKNSTYEPEFKKLFAEIDDLKKLTPKDFVEQYTKRIPDDQLASLIEYIKENRDEA